MVNKDNIKNMDAKGWLEKLKNSSTYILFAIVIVLLLVLHFEKMSVLENLVQSVNRTETEAKSIKLLIGKQINELSDEVKNLSQDIEKVYTVEQEQNKTISIIPTDNAFFKQWLKSNHKETLESIEAIRIRLDDMKNNINNIKTDIGNIGAATINANSSPIKERVEAISI